MARKLKSDRVLFLATILLVGVSIVMVYSASAPVALERYGRASRFLFTQGMWTLLGIAMLYIVMRVDYRVFKLGSGALHSPAHRFYAGLNLKL